MDPWQDYLALPVAPLVLLIQMSAFFLPWRAVRWGVAVSCPLAILAMLLYVDSLPEEPDEGVNIGAGVLVLWLSVSLALLAIALVVEGVRLARAPRFEDSPP